MRRISTDSNLFSLSYTSGPPARRGGSRCLSQDEEQPVPGVEPDRAAFINTALVANPGISLRAFFSPVIGLKRVLFRQQRLTQHALEDPAWLRRRYKGAIAALVRALGDASTDLLDAPMQVDENVLAQALRDKLVPAVYEPGTVLAYPGELPEAMFVHVVLAGSVRVVTYQPQNRKGAVADSTKRQYFVANDTIRLGGSVGLHPELLKSITRPQETSAEATSEIASTSNMSTNIQRSLRTASRMIGQPTLLPLRTEVLRAPYVSCAVETLGLEPHRLATVMTEATISATRGDRTGDSSTTEVMQIRARDLHQVLIQFAQSQGTPERGQLSPLSRTVTRNAGVASPGRSSATMREFIDAARVKSISRHYPLNEVLMRQSWLLQDTPAHTIRALVTQLTPRIFLPGEAILCPHTTVRQLCFLRRGTMTIEEPPFPAYRGSGCCCAQPQHGSVLEEIPTGASFGELSVLFGEPRQFVLRAKTVCDVWCLSRRSFAETVRRDDALRESLLSKAAALRMRWLGEQRFTDTLARQLRESCDLFREAPECFIRLVQERLEPHVYPPGTLLASTSTRCEYMFIILQGRVSSIVDGVAEYGPGSVLGEPTIIHHRWPIAVVSKTMVEGWRLSRKDLIDALKRIEILRQHSGKAGAQISQLMQSVFRPPVPQLETDMLGRSRMPAVEPPPRGETYMDYAQSLAEVQLQSICFRFRDLVSWNDICYETLPGRRGFSRPASAPLAADKSLTNETAISEATKSSPRSMKPKKPPGSSTEMESTRRGKGNAAGRSAKRGASLPAAERETRTRTSADCRLPFHVNPLIVQQPFAHPDRRRAQESRPGVQDPLLARLRAIKATSEVRLSHGDAPHPQLGSCLALLDARDKLRRSETRHKQQQQQHVGGDAHLQHIGSPTASHAAGAAAAAAAALGNVKGNASRECPAPVHIFFPRVQITVEEAVAVGFVLQLPDTRRIQSCVSAIDSDVTLGLPQHRQRRRDMAAIPNDRHPRHCFLFAASQLGERSAGEVIVREAAQQEEDSRERAQYLTSVIVAQLAGRRGHVERTKTPEDETLNAAVEWNGRSPLRSPAVSRTVASYTPRTRSLARSTTRETEAAFLQLMRENPERALGSLRVRFNVADTGEQGDAPDIIASARGSSAATAPRDELLESLRHVTEGDIPNLDETLAPPHSASDEALAPEENAENGGEKTAEKPEPAEPTPLDIFAREDALPLFVDGYGELGARPRGVLGEANAKLLMAPNANQALLHGGAGGPISPRGEEPAACPSGHGASTGAASPQRVGGEGAPRAGSVAAIGRPPRFMMPDAMEASMTMRRIQRDVEGLNAVAEEQRRERTRRALPVEPPLGTQRLVEEWGAAYHENVRDPFALATIPKPLLAEAGTDYLTQAYRATRGAGVHSDASDKKGDHRDGTRGTDGDASVSRSLYAPIGARKLGLKPRPLINPATKMSREDYEHWTQERDKLFAGTKSPPATV